MLLRPLTLALLLGTVALGPVVPAMAQDAQTMDRINRLEREIQTLQRNVYRGGTPPASGGGGGGSLTDGGDGTSAANRLNSRIDDLENQVRQLTGRFEEVEFTASQANRRMDKLTEDVDFRLNQLERGGNSGQQTGSVEQVKPTPAQQGVPAPGTPVAGQNRGSTSSTPGQAPTKEGFLGSMPTDAQGRPIQGGGGQQQAAAPQGNPASGKGKLPNGTPQERYNYAYKLLVQSDYADAEQAFREFLSAHPKDALAGNAQYWLGETYYVRGQYEPASQAFLQGYSGYKGNSKGKAPDSLLKLGMSLAALKKTPEACAALGQLGKDFPDALPHVKDAAVRERQKINCK